VHAAIIAVKWCSHIDLITTVWRWVARGQEAQQYANKTGGRMALNLEPQDG
jgi:hypothetical protein